LEGVFYFKILSTFGPKMGRVLAIDYGKKRVGLAVTDSLKISSRILPYQTETKIRQWLLEYLNAEDVESIVIGYPEHIDGSYTDLTIDIDALIKYIENLDSNIAIIRSEESFSSKDALEMMIKSGISKKKRREKGLVDSYSALVILEEYLRK